MNLDIVRVVYHAVEEVLCILSEVEQYAPLWVYLLIKVDNHSLCECPRCRFRPIFRIKNVFFGGFRSKMDAAVYNIRLSV